MNEKTKNFSGYSLKSNIIQLFCYKRESYYIDLSPVVVANSRFVGLDYSVLYLWGSPPEELGYCG